MHRTRGRLMARVMTAIAHCLMRRMFHEVRLLYTKSFVDILYTDNAT